MQHPLIIAYGKSHSDNKPIHKRTTVKKFFKKLSKHEIRKVNKLSVSEVDEVKNGPYFIPAKLKKVKGIKGWRNTPNVVKYYGAALDLDDTDLNGKEIKKKLADWVHCVYSTISHKIGNKGRRYRVFLPYAEPISVVEHTNIVKMLSIKLGSAGVDSASSKDIQVMYLPATVETHAGKKARFYSHSYLKGSLLCQDNIKLTPHESFQAQELSNVEASSQIDVNAEVDDGARNTSLVRYVGKLIGVGHDKPTVLDMALSYNLSKCNPPKSASEVKTIVNSVFKTHTHKEGNLSYDQLHHFISRQKDPTTKESYTEIIKRLAANRSNIDKLDFGGLERLSARRTQLGLKDLRERITDQSEIHKVDKADKKEEEEKSFALQVADQFENFVFLKKDNVVWDLERMQMDCVKDAFNTYYSGLYKASNIINILVEYGGIKTAITHQYLPGQESYFEFKGNFYVNTFEKLKIRARQGDVSPMLNHLKYLIPNYKDRQVILCFIAFIVQNPGEKIRWMPIIKGYKGIGKSLIFDRIIKPVIGKQNVRTVEEKDLKDKFDGWKAEKQIICIHELKTGSTYKERQNTTDTLKPFISDDQITIRPMHSPSKTVDNISNVIGFTNHDDSLVITEDERRYFFVRSEVKPKSPRYYEKLCYWLDSNHREMLYFFKHKKMRQFSPNTTPLNDYTREIKVDSLRWPASIIRKALDDGSHFFNKDSVCTWDSIVKYVGSESTGVDALKIEDLRKPTSSKSYLLIHTLKEMGFLRWKNKFNKRGRIMVDNKYRTIWKTPYNHHELGTLQMREIIENQDKRIYDFD